MSTTVVKLYYSPQMDKLYKKAGKIQKKKDKKKKEEVIEEDRHIYRAFVTCNKAIDKEILVEQYRMSTFFLGFLFQSGWKRMLGKRIVVKEAPEPSNILWENQDCPGMERFVRKTVDCLDSRYINTPCQKL